LGVLKAGGTYIPLDPGYPLERLVYMLADSKAEMLLSDRESSRKLSEYRGNVVLLDEKRMDIDGFPGSNPVNQVRGGNLAYVLYTSGSTGRPKGVGISHEALTNLLFSILNKPGMHAGDVILGIASFSFDISVTEMFLPLTVGAQVRILSREASRD